MMVSFCFQFITQKSVVVFWWGIGFKMSEKSRKHLCAILCYKWENHSSVMILQIVELGQPYSLTSFGL